MSRAAQVVRVLRIWGVVAAICAASPFVTTRAGFLRDAGAQAEAASEAAPAGPVRPGHNPA